MMAGIKDAERLATTPRRNRGGLRAQRLLWRAALVLLIVWPPVAWAAARALIVAADAVPQPAAIVILSGAATYVERTRTAAQLFAAGRAPKIILTNDNERSSWVSAEQRNPFFSERAAAELLNAGVPANKIELIPQPIFSTYEEACAVRAYAVAHELRSLLVVTSAYHSRRAWWTWERAFRGSGIELGMACAPTGEQTPAPAVWWMHGHGWRAVAAEYPKLVYYWLRYA